jgi:hypothetical protein
MCRVARYAGAQSAGGVILVIKEFDGFVEEITEILAPIVRDDVLFKYQISSRASRISPIATYERKRVARPTESKVADAHSRSQNNRHDAP